MSDEQRSQRGWIGDPNPSSTLCRGTSSGAGEGAAPETDPLSALPLLLRHGRDAVSFQALESHMRHWRDAPAPDGTGALVAYCDTGSAWIAGGGPLAGDDDLARAADRFAAAARAAGRRASFFASESSGALAGFDTLFLGEQPLFHPGRWVASLPGRRRLREQLRRARAKGVSVRLVMPDELAPGSPLRGAVEELAAEWLGSRRMEPMSFLVALEPFHAPDEHRYVVAEQRGRLVGFLSAVPIYARRGWLVEDVLRGARAPNGTSETLLDALMRDVADSELVTLGLAPLSGPISRWQRLVRYLTRPLYDFRGVRAFKERLRPVAWEPVWLAFPRGEAAALHLADGLRAFAGGSLVRFGIRSMVRHPGGPPWLLALPLAPWTVILAARAALGYVQLLGWTRPVLAAWAGFDALLCYALFRTALRPTVGRLVVAAAAAAADAALSLHHLVASGPGDTAVQALFRATQTCAPVFGTAALLWAATRAARDERFDAARRRE